MNIVSDPELIDKTAWKEFVINHPNGNIFQTPEMFSVYKKTKNYKPFLVFSTNGDEITGILSGVIQKEFKGVVLGFLSSRCIIHGGPLVKDNNPIVTESLILTFNKYVRRSAIYVQIRNIFDIKEQDKKILKKLGFLYKPHLDIHIDLSQNPEDYWNSLKSNLRTKIRKSDKNHITFSILSTKEEILEAYKILQEVYSNAKMPMPDITLFFAAFDELVKNGKAVFFIAKMEEKIIGLRFVLLYKFVIYDWFAGSKMEFYRYYPNDFLAFKVIEWGMLQPNFEVFDFGGAGSPKTSYGVRDHKLKFSDNLIEIGRFEKIYHPFVFSISKIGFKVWKKVR